MEDDILILGKEFTDKEGNKHTIIYANSFGYLYEILSIKGKVSFIVLNRLKTAKMPSFQKWEFKKDKEAISKFNNLKFEL